MSFSKKSYIFLRPYIAYVLRYYLSSCNPTQNQKLMRNVLIISTLFLLPATVLAHTPGVPAELQALCVAVLLLTPFALLIGVLIYLHNRKRAKAEKAEKAQEAEKRAKFVREQLKKNLPKSKLEFLEVPADDKESLHYLTYLYFKVKKSDKEEEEGGKQEDE